MLLHNVTLFKDHLLSVCVSNVFEVFGFQNVMLTMLDSHQHLLLLLLLDLLIYVLEALIHLTTLMLKLLINKIQPFTSHTILCIVLLFLNLALVALFLFNFLFVLDNVLLLIEVLLPNILIILLFLLSELLDTSTFGKTFLYSIGYTSLLKSTNVITAFYALLE